MRGKIDTSRKIRGVLNTFCCTKVPRETIENEVLRATISISSCNHVPWPMCYHESYVTLSHALLHSTMIMRMVTLWVTWHLWHF